MEKTTLVVLLVACMMVNLSFLTPTAHANRGPLVKDKLRQSFVLYHEKILNIIESVLNEDKQENKNLSAFYAIKEKTLPFVNETSETFLVSAFTGLRSIVVAIRSWWDSEAIPLLTGQYDPEELKNKADQLLALVENYITFHVLRDKIPKEESESNLKN